MRNTTRISQLRRLVGRRLSLLAAAQLALGASACVDQGEEPPPLTGTFAAEPRPPAPPVEADAGDAGAGDGGIR